MLITPDKIVSLGENEIFVYGSNYSSRHGKGAAVTAVKKFGPIMGRGVGWQGRSYGLAIKDAKLKTLSLEAIDIQISKLVKVTIKHPKLIFLVTEVGCGLAGYKPKDIAPLFFQYDLPNNISLPESFWRFKSYNLATHIQYIC